MSLCEEPVDEGPPVRPALLLQPGLHKVASGASAASGQTQILWTNVDQNHVYFVQALYGKFMKRYLTQTNIVYDSHKTASLVYKGLNDVF